MGYGAHGYRIYFQALFFETMGFFGCGVRDWVYGDLAVFIRVGFGDRLG